MAEAADFQVILEKVEEARANLGPDFEAELIVLQQESHSVAELMTAARDLSEPPPPYFTRG